MDGGILLALILAVAAFAAGYLGTRYREEGIGSKAVMSLQLKRE
jgi:hypothetical protein